MNRLILDFFEDTAARLPDKIAFVDEDASFTFEELRAASHAFATAILADKREDRVVAFYMDKCASAIAGFLGAACAGCAYSTINLRYPAARVKSILDTLAPCFVVTDREHYEMWNALGIEDVQPLLIEDLLAGEADESALSSARAKIVDTDPLYINFTSGSTGTPKGVAVCHRSVVDFITCFTEIFAITENDCIANQAPFDFDVSVKDIFSGLFTGATVSIVPTAYFTQPLKLMDFLCDHNTTVLIWAVSALCFITTMNAMEYRVPESIRAILFSGEVMPVKHLNKLKKYLPDAMYVNLYGPTEITCNCTYYVVDREFVPGENLPIGVPFPNERVFLLDENDALVTETGGTGELCVAGTALALGYYRNPEKTAEVFVQNPLNAALPELIYRTGDLVRIDENGQMIYVSRKDFQVKHMGHRIEMGEIETAMSAVPGVDRALCIYDHAKNKILAYYTGSVEKDELTAALKEVFPQYMLPNKTFHCAEMPLNKNGKIDRERLRAEYK